jgi:TonB-linked SusC/RagA family outer membrane protein
MKKQVLNKLGKTTMLLTFLMLPILVFSQVRYTIKGKVTDGAGEALIGANVNIGGTLQGTNTDLEGNYVLSGAVKEGTYSLVVSYVGYAAKVEQININEAGKDQTVDFKLGEDRMNLDEVVVTGNSGTTTRRQLGNSISVVRAENLERTGTTNTLGALSGKVMGAQISQNSGDPAGGFSVRLRGAGSINSSSDPLYIIDGVIVDNSSQNVINRSADAMGTSFSAGQNRLVDINPNDIDRVEVLNGAAAAAIYGSRAANGVVQIFTKRGKSGKSVIEFSTSIMSSSLRKKVFMSTHEERFGVKGNDRLETTQDRLTMLTNLYPAAAGKNLQQTMDANGVKYLGVGLDPAKPSRFMLTDKYAVKRYDYQDLIFTDAIGTDNNLSLTGGNDKTQYFASFGYYDNDGIIKNTNYKKYTGRLNLDHMLNSWAKFSAGLSYTYGISKDMPNGNNFFNPISSIFIIDNVWDLTERDANGNLKQVERVRVNPLSIIETFKINQRTNRTIANARLELFPIKGLKIDASIGSDAYTLRGDEYHPRLPYELSAGVVPDFYPDGYVAQAVSNVSLLNHNFMANYTRDFGKINSSTTAGYDIQYSNTSFISQEGRSLSFGTTVNAANNLFKRSELAKTEQLQNGYFLQQTIGFNQQIYLTLAARVDGSSVFAPENRNQLYKKAGLSWVLSDYWKNSTGLTKIISSAKIRASYGEAGNLTGIGAYDRFDNYATGTYNAFTSIAPSRTLANSNVKPERKRENEFGADLTFLNGRIGLSANVYDQKVTDLLITSVMSPSGGGTRIIKNAPDSTYLTNKGLELMLTASIVKSKNFNWNVGLNWSKNKNTVWGVEGGVIDLRGADGTQRVVNGQPYGVFYGRYYARDASGNLLLTSQNLRQPARGTQPVSYKPGTEVLNNGQPSLFEIGADGKPTKATTVELRKVIGDPNPDWVGSFSSGMNYKKLSFAFQFDAFWGGDMYNWNRVTSNNVGWGLLADQELKGEVPRGTVASVAGGVIGQRIQEEHVEDASYIKLREIALTYDFANAIKGCKGLTLSLIGRNIVSFDKYQGFDPEINSAGQSDRVRGDDFGGVPIPRTIMARVGVKF